MEDLFYVTLGVLALAFGIGLIVSNQVTMRNKNAIVEVLLACSFFLCGFVAGGGLQ